MGAGRSALVRSTGGEPGFSSMWRFVPSDTMSCALHGSPRVSKGWLLLLIVAAALVLVGVLWLLQGAGAVHVRPILCVSNCKPVTKSTGWLVAGVALCTTGLALTLTAARHLRRR